MELIQHEYETRMHSASCDSQKVTGKTDTLSAGSHVNDAVCDSQIAADSAAAAVSGTSCQTVIESSCVMLSSSDVLCCASVDESTSVDEHVVDFLLSLFWVLESKRLDRSCEHTDNLTLLTAPFEQRKDSSIADLDGRSSDSHIHLYVHYAMCSGSLTS